MIGEARYGERKAIVEAEDWEGPKFEVCANKASICRAFPLESSRRRERLSFNHHAEVASLPPDEADALLNWCEETPKPHSTRELSLNECFRRAHAMGDVHRRADFVGGRR